MQLLTAVNLVLPKLGERAVTSLTVKHPTLAILLPIIDQTQRNTLMPGWWFNEFEYKAYPNEFGEIDIGADALAFIPHEAGAAVVRGQRLYNPATLSYVFTEHVPGTVIQFVQFDELPESASSYVFYSSLVEAYATDLGVSNELSVWQSLAASGYSNMLAEHLKQRKHSTRNSRRWRNLIYSMQG
jgi:hypothetical protein